MLWRQVKISGNSGKANKGTGVLQDAIKRNFMIEQIEAYRLPAKQRDEERILMGECIPYHMGKCADKKRKQHDGKMAFDVRRPAYR